MEHNALLERGLIITERVDDQLEVRLVSANDVYLGKILYFSFAAVGFEYS